MTSALTENIAAVARAELARRNISRATAAEALGISRTAMWARLRGDTAFAVAELEKLAALLDVPVSLFLPAERAA